MVEHRVEIVDVAVAVDSVSASVVRAVAEAVHPPGVTRADLVAVVGVLVDAIRESASADRIARQVEEQAPPMFAQLGRYIRTPGGVVAILSMLLAVLANVRDVAADDTQEPPAVTVQVEVPTEDVERIVEERLCELSESGGALPGAEDAPPEDGPPAHR